MSNQSNDNIMERAEHLLDLAGQLAEEATSTTGGKMLDYQIARTIKAIDANDLEDLSVQLVSLQHTVDNVAHVLAEYSQDAMMGWEAA